MKNPNLIFEKEETKCCYEKCNNIGHIFVEDLDGNKYHLVCWLLSMDIDLSKVTFNYDTYK